jgi:hypothetical protein
MKLLTLRLALVPGDARSGGEPNPPPWCPAGSVGRTLNSSKACFSRFRQPFRKRRGWHGNANELAGLATSSPLGLNRLGAKYRRTMSGESEKGLPAAWRKDSVPRESNHELERRWRASLPCGWTGGEQSPSTQPRHRFAVSLLCGGKIVRMLLWGLPWLIGHRSVGNSSSSLFLGLIGLT